jgi:undecaprenyl diphosphate synthase
LVLAFNYGSRQEIVDAAKRLAREAKEGRLDIEGVDADMFGDYLYTAGLPEPDLLIRTSNELRLSNFLLWQLSYAEFYFSKKHWPDFRKDDLLKAVCAYAARERRFGGLTRV